MSIGKTLQNQFMSCIVALKQTNKKPLFFLLSTCLFQLPKHRRFYLKTFLLSPESKFIPLMFCMIFLNRKYKLFIKVLNILIIVTGNVSCLQM